MSTPCLALGCALHVPFGRPLGRRFCDAHLALLSSAQAIALYESFLERDNRPGYPRNVAYYEAMADAIEALATLEGRPTENAYRQLANHLRVRAPRW